MAGRRPTTIGWGRVWLLHVAILLPVVGPMYMLLDWLSPRSPVFPAAHAVSRLLCVCGFACLLVLLVKFRVSIQAAVHSELTQVRSAWQATRSRGIRAGLRIVPWRALAVWAAKSWLVCLLFGLGISAIIVVSLIVSLAVGPQVGALTWRKTALIGSLAIQFGVRVGHLAFLTWLLSLPLFAVLIGRLSRRAERAATDWDRRDDGTVVITSRARRAPASTFEIRTGARPALRGAQLNSCNLPSVNLAGADLERASLSLARLAGAVFRDANLSRADLAGADLEGADLRGADLRGADFCGPPQRWIGGFGFATLTRADLRGAKWDETTRWPPGFDPDRHIAGFAREVEPAPAPEGEGSEVSPHP